MRALLGIDLAAQATSTGIVLLARDPQGRWAAVEPVGPATDDFLVELARDADVIGVDAPLGWPSAFVNAIADHHTGRPWTGGVDRSRLTHRDTDREVQLRTGRLPLSASADKLGICTMRSALLQLRWATEVWGAPAPRDGTGPLVETYPAAALRAWELSYAGYKGAVAERAGTAANVRRSIVDQIANACPWLEVTEIAERCAASDHVLDALLCALVAIAAHLGQTSRPSDAAVARAEGWIHVPTRPLAELDPG